MEAARTGAAQQGAAAAGREWGGRLAAAEAALAAECAEVKRLAAELAAARRGVPWSPKAAEVGAGWLSTLLCTPYWHCQIAVKSQVKGCSAGLVMAAAALFSYWCCRLACKGYSMQRACSAQFAALQRKIDELEAQEGQRLAAAMQAAGART
jgi:hypothetical protein